MSLIQVGPEIDSFIFNISSVSVISNSVMLSSTECNEEIHDILAYLYSYARSSEAHKKFDKNEHADFEYDFLKLLDYIISLGGKIPNENY
jgi:hypothetical protein